MTRHVLWMTTLCSSLALAAPAGAQPKPADGVGGTWRLTYGEKGDESHWLIRVARHGAAVCGTTSYEGDKRFDGSVSFSLAGTKLTGTWWEAQKEGPLELELAGAAARGSFAGDGGPTPLAGGFKAAHPAGPRNVGGEYLLDFENSTCRMKLTHKGARLDGVGVYKNTEEPCFTLKGTLTGDMAVGEMTWVDGGAQKQGHFQWRYVRGAGGGYHVVGTWGEPDKGIISCHSGGKIRTVNEVRLR